MMAADYTLHGLQERQKESSDMTRVIAKKAFQRMLRDLRAVNRDKGGEVFAIAKDSQGKYTVTARNGDEVLWGIPGSHGYLSWFSPKVFE